MHEPTLKLDEKQAGSIALPQQVGPYRILGLLGEGGMGRVYLAREEHPPREVALKVVRGLSGNALARFQREIQTLAQLEHPGIARLYAAGEDVIGGMPIPWLAMELIRGQDLRSHVERERPDLVTRLRLLIALSRAVQHAHAHGIVHRDLKPGNILIDAQGSPHILDFGVARLRDTDADMTQAGQIIGTLPYMSPEQLTGQNAKVDARSDVYALGVIAYELISGRLPHPRLTTSTLFEALDLVRQEDPPRLSQLNPQARGDLDRIVMKALAADRQQRYASAGELADDLQRLIEHRPVLARAPSLGYRASRFVRRHRALTAAAGVVFVALMGTAVVSTLAAQHARRAQAQAEARAAEAAAINQFLETMLLSASPEQAHGREIRVTDVLDQSERELESLEAPATVRLALASTLAGTRLSLGQYERGLAMNQAALDLLDEANTPATTKARLLRQRASLLTELARFDEARRAIAQARPLLPATSPAERVGLDLTAARLEHEAGQTPAALAGYRSVLEQAVLLDPADPEVARTIDIARSNLALALMESGELDEAETLTRQVLDQRRARHGELDPRTLASRQKLALLFAARGDHSATEAEARQTWEQHVQVLGADNIGTLMIRQTLANALLQQGRLDEAEPHLRATLDGFQTQLGEDHAHTLSALSSLAFLLEERRQWDEAEAMYRRILAIQASNPLASLGPRNNLAMLMIERGNAQAALAEFDPLLEATRQLLGEDHAYHLIFSSNRALALLRSGQAEPARRLLEPVLAMLQQRMGTDHPRTRTAAQRLLQAYEDLQLDDKAARLRAAYPSAFTD